MEVGFVEFIDVMLKDTKEREDKKEERKSEENGGRSQGRG